MEEKDPKETGIMLKADFQEVLQLIHGKIPEEVYDLLLFRVER